MLLAPFFFMGWCLCRVFSLAPRHIQRLYGVDLAGAALGTLLLFPLLQPLGPERLLLCASLVAVAAAIVLSPTARTALSIALVGVLLALTPDLLGARYLTLVTTDAFAEYFAHLAPDGILQINHLFYPRIIATAAAAWRADGRGDFRPHAAVSHYADGPDYLPTILIRMAPWTPAEIADLQAFFAFPAVREAPYRLVENPLDPAASFLPDAFYAGSLTAAFRNAVPYDIRPATDDRPFLRVLRQSMRPLQPDARTGVDVTTAHALNRALYKGWLPKDWLHIIGAAAASVFYGLIFVLVPMTYSGVGRAHGARATPVLVYFSVLGFAFMTLELVFIQVFTKLIGYPLYPSRSRDGLHQR